MKYDALGRCISRQLNNGTITYYYYDGEKPIQEYSGGALIANNVYGKGVDEIVARYQGNSLYYFYPDHEGSITHVIDNNKNVVEKYRYDAFGAPTILSASNTQLSTSAIGNRFMFTGREWAGAQSGVTFGFYEYRARAYHPGLGRFMSEDPKGFDAGDYNLFRYCDNDPEDRTDAMGLDDNGVASQMMHNRQLSASDAVWEMAKWADSSNTFSGTYSQFLSNQGFAVGETAPVVSGQVIGGPADSRLIKNATPGTANDRDTPNRLELGKVEDKGYFKRQHLQLKHNGSDLFGKRVGRRAR
ncbi:MAG: RHS repeat-associated core domain-containing protein [Verrucomicrobia bacterium]|nr:RHS repeat-associated core domain-containing protein [Verrucomicrobiota bacterium]